VTRDLQLKFESAGDGGEFVVVIPRSVSDEGSAVEVSP